MILFKHTLFCPDCGRRPWQLGEDFYVTDKLWKSTIPKQNQTDVFCITCFESRLGRKLKKRDFKAWFHNNRWWGNKTQRVNCPPSKQLKERLQLNRKSTVKSLTFFKG